MNKNIFISNIQINELPVNLKNKYQLEIELFDKNNKQSSFTTSLMKFEEIEAYKKNLFKILKGKNKLQIIHSPHIKSYNLVVDDNNKIIGLELENGLILKNEIKIF